MDGDGIRWEYIEVTGLDNFMDGDERWMTGCR